MKTNTPTQKIALTLASPRFIALGLLAGVVLALCLAGCKRPTPNDGHLSAGTADSMAGEYALVSVDGKTVPCVVTHEGADLTVKSGRFTINTNGTCRSLCVFSVAGHPDIERAVAATYTVSGTQLTMRWQGAGTTTGNVEGANFTMNNEGMIFAYRK